MELERGTNKHNRCAVISKIISLPDERSTLINPFRLLFLMSILWAFCFPRQHCRCLLVIFFRQQVNWPFTRKKQQNSSENWYLIISFYQFLFIFTKGKPSRDSVGWKWDFRFLSRFEPINLWDCFRYFGWFCCNI